MQKSFQMPTIVLVGRPNVGKSTLFNRLCRKWASIVEDRPGITRDRIHGKAIIGGHEIEVVDTGGLEQGGASVVEKKMSHQAYDALGAADLVLFVLDGRQGVHPMDSEWIRKVRKMKCPKLFLVNKLDGSNLDDNIEQFHELGVNPMIPISAEKERNFSSLYEQILIALKLEDQTQNVEKQELYEEELDKSGEGELKVEPFKIAIAGRPNVGKSTLLNAFLGEERCITDNNPGTTRDPIHTDFEFDGNQYKLIDTAGIRKRAKTVERVEKFSVVQSLKVIEAADVVLLLMDGTEGPTEQDAHVAGHAFEKSKAIILLVNKWDEGSKIFEREQFVHKMELKVNFLQHCPLLFVSAKTKKNLGKIFDTIEQIRAQYERKIKTSDLNKAFEHIVEHHPLPTYKGQTIKMYYATQVSTKPPTFVVFCNYPKQVHFTYRRYVTNALREMFKLENVPVRVIFKARK